MNDKLPVLELMVTITDRTRGGQSAYIFRKMNVPLVISCLGDGTATAEIRNLLSSTEKAKVITFALLPKPWVPVVISQLADEMQLRKAGKGIVFTIPLSSINKAAPVSYVEAMSRNVNEERVMYKPIDKKFEMIVVSTEDGVEDVIMDAARSAGARGGTVVHGHMVGDDKTESFFGMKLYDTKDVIAIIAPSEIKHNIMGAIAKVLNDKKLDKSVIFSLPVNDVVGLDGE